MAPLPLRFVQSASRLSQLPESKVELAVIGRSNVGKSSLINALANRKKLAKTSKTPGATQLINIFELEPEGSGQWLVDLPGYGFAKAPKHEQERWRRMIEEYLTESPTLGAVLVLIDGAVGPTPLDLQTIAWLESVELPYRFVATKADKVKPSKSQGPPHRGDSPNSTSNAATSYGLAPRTAPASKDLRKEIRAFYNDDPEDLG